MHGWDEQPDYMSQFRPAGTGNNLVYGAAADILTQLYGLQAEAAGART